MKPAIPDNLIINADDFGLHRRVSEAIAICLSEGLINSFSVLSCGDPFHADLLRELAARHPEARIGVHLSLIGAGEGYAEHPGHFRDFLARYLTGRQRLPAVREAWEDQVRAVAKVLGGFDRIAHLDSHQHLHVLPGLWGEALSLKRRFGIPRLRVPYEGLRLSVTRRFPFGLALQALALLRRGPGSRRFIGFAASTAFTVEANRSLLREVLRRPEESFELMVHPALPGPEEPGSPPPSQAEELDELRKLRGFFAAGNA